MRHLLMRAALAVTAAVIVSPVRAQVAPGPVVPVQWPAYPGGPYQPYAFPAPTPQDAYRDGLINRWELEQYEGPLPQALQGPAVNSNRGGANGGGRE
jgi:hypothetical protein